MNISSDLVPASARYLPLAGLMLVVLMQQPALGNEEDPPNAVTGNGTCQPSSKHTIPVANLRMPHLPLSPWDMTQGHNNTLNDPHLTVDVKQEDPETGEDVVVGQDHYYGHLGIDLRGDSSTAGSNIQDIRSVFSGAVVATVNQDGAKSWGNSVVVASRINAYSDAIITAQYHHLADRYVEVVGNSTGACPIVDPGDLLGKEGMTGNAEGPHLHFTVRYWASLEHLNEWLSKNNNGTSVHGPGYAHNKLHGQQAVEDSTKFRGKWSPDSGFDANSPYSHYGFLDPQAILQDYFKDLQGQNPPHKWAIEHVKKMRYYGIEMGEWDGSFGTTLKVKRREAARWLRVALGARYDGYLPQNELFADVPPSDPDYYYIQELTTYPWWAPSMTVIDPDPNSGIFDPDRDMNRAEALKLVVLTFFPEEYQVFLDWWNDHVDDDDFYEQLTDRNETATHYSDVSLSAWYAPYVYFGTVKRFKDGWWGWNELDVDLVQLDAAHPNFFPSNGVDRAEMAKWVVRGHEKLHGAGEPSPCEDTICSMGEFCNPFSGDCEAATECIATPGEPCEGGGAIALCGDGDCNGDENCETCPGDCGACPPGCPNGACDNGETCNTCPQDCEPCGDVCGDNQCTGVENCQTCPADCGACPPGCPNNLCDNGETCNTCPQDCGACPPSCPNNLCDNGETCNTCPQDCGACPPVCGDNQCNGNEDCNSCSQDCGDCICVNDEVDQQACDPGIYCPPGTEERVCNNNSWGPWGTCESDLGLKFHGDGGKRCGPVVCLQITGVGNDSSLSATVSKADNGAFANDVYLVIFQPSSNDVVQYGCVPAAGQTSYNFQIPVNDLSISLGDTIAVNAQALSPCVNGANYISDDAYISQCSSN